uniref:Uncharacterized protein n=1 Tax=Ixodes ricinus TaxID=34613 RepID=A0A6B0UF21_IXORI
MLLFVFFFSIQLSYKSVLGIFVSSTILALFISPGTPTCNLWDVILVPSVWWLHTPLHPVTRYRLAGVASLGRPSFECQAGALPVWLTCSRHASERP